MDSDHFQTIKVKIMKRLSCCFCTARLRYELQFTVTLLQACGIKSRCEAPFIEAIPLKNPRFWCQITLVGGDVHWCRTMLEVKVWWCETTLKGFVLQLSLWYYTEWWWGCFAVEWQLCDSVVIYLVQNVDSAFYTTSIRALQHADNLLLLFQYTLITRKKSIVYLLLFSFALFICYLS